MNLFDFFGKAFKKITKPTPADFRRGIRKHRIFGYSVDKNSAHVGTFKGKITPMKRRFSGVSRMAKGK